jgi:putative flippase GtrA
MRSLPERVVAVAAQPFVVDLVRYGLVSIAALACDYGLLLAFTAAGLHYLLAAGVSFSIGIAVAYVLSARFVFADRRDASRLREAAGFLAVGLAGLLLTQLLLFVFVSGLSIDVAIAKIPTTACVFVFNFLARRGLVFTRLRPSLA